MRSWMYFFCYVAVFLICVLFTRWLFNTVIALDIPNWLKYMILR